MMVDGLINSRSMPSHMMNFIKFAITLTVAGIIGRVGIGVLDWE